MKNKEKRRSKLEEKFESILQESNIKYCYETTVIPYTVPSSDHKYTLDWTISNGVLIETKGYLSDLAERRKYLLIKEQHPDIDIRFVFVNVNKLCGGMKMTHGEWAKKHGFKYCDISDIDQITAWLMENDKNLSN